MNGLLTTKPDQILKRKVWSSRTSTKERPRMTPPSTDQNDLSFESGPGSFAALPGENQRPGPMAPGCACRDV